MSDPVKEAVLTKATSAVEEVQSRLKEVHQHLQSGEDLAALGAVAGVSERVRYVETLLTVLRDFRAKEPNNRK